eukprot:6192269-Pleurochrysis_carterae.AAC.1
MRRCAISRLIVGAPSRRGHAAVRERLRPHTEHAASLRTTAKRRQRARSIEDSSNWRGAEWQRL